MVSTKMGKNTHNTHQLRSLRQEINLIYIYINKINKKEPAMEPPDHPQGAEHQHAVCSMKRSVGIFVCLQVYVGMYNPFSSKFFKD